MITLQIDLSELVKQYMERKEDLDDISYWKSSLLRYPPRWKAQAQMMTINTAAMYRPVPLPTSGGACIFAVNVS